MLFQLMLPSDDSGMVIWPRTSLIASSGVNLASKVRAQLIYTVGHLNQENGVARLNAVKLTNMKPAYIGGGLYRIRYHARLPVAWASKTNIPTQYTLTLPKRVPSLLEAAAQ